MAVWEWDARTDLVKKSPELNRLLGFPPNYQFTREDTTARYYPGERDRVQAAARAALENGTRHFEVEFRYGWPGPPQWFLLRAEIALDRAGAPASVLGVLLDITERENTRAELREREAELRDALSAASMGTYAYNHATGEFRSSPTLNAIYGYPPDKPLTRDDLRARYHPDDRTVMEDLLNSMAVSPARNFELELRLLLPDQTVRWIYGKGEYVRDGAGRLLFSRGVAMDITARKKWDEHQQLLINELNHRVKNTLATVQSIASQTLRNAGSAAEAHQVFEARLLALSRAHDVLTRESWDGAELSEIVAQALAPHRNFRERRFHVKGPSIRLAPRTALALSMAFHELATNAVKYGALSNAEGELHLDWSIDRSRKHPRLLLRWEERGGPPVAPPKRRGFGSRLVERSLAQDLEGEVRIDFSPAGVVCLIEAPLTH